MQGHRLRDAEGHILGTLCLLDTQPRTKSLRDAKLLELLADEVMIPLRNRSRSAGTAKRPEGAGWARPGQECNLPQRSSTKQP